MNLIGTLLSARLIGYIVLAWALSLVFGMGGLWLYMDGSRDAATANAAKACAEAKADHAEAKQAATLEAVRGALKARAEAQAEIDAQRDAEQAVLWRQVAAERRRAQTLSNQLARHLDATPLPAVCRLDAERVRLYNAVRRGGADADVAAARPRLSSVLGFGLPPAAAPRASPGWYGEPGWFALAGASGWRGEAGVLDRADGVSGLRAPWHPRGSDSLTPEAP